MGKDSRITWTDHTFNPWWGCVKVNRGCGECYANSLAARYGHDVWGKKKPRRLFGEKHWSEPRKWDRRAKEQGKRAKVFSGSMCDVLERHVLPEWQAKLDAEREKLWALIEETPNLDWLLLTKRVEELFPLLPRHWLEDRKLPRNAWFGYSACDEDTLEEAALIAESWAWAWNPSVLFLSLEPMLGPVDLECWLEHDPIGWYDDDLGDYERGMWGLDWVIIGCQSKGNHLGSLGLFETEEAWIAGALDVVRQCREMEIPLFVKQVPLGGKLSKDPADWPEELRVQDFPR